MSDTLTDIPVADLAGGFTQDAFEKHIATQGKAPAWWLERKRTSYARFAALPMPSRKDEGWRFSNLSGLGLAGFAVPSTQSKAAAVPFAIETSATLLFSNGRSVGVTALSQDLASKGVIVSTLSKALAEHPELLKEHFMAQPQKLGSTKFASLHEAFVTDGAFIFVPKGVEITKPIVVVHSATGSGAAIFPHTLIIAEDNSKVSVVDYFASTDETRQFACGANDIYAGHGAKVAYAAAQCWSLDSLSFQFNSTVVRRDARVQSLNLHLGAKQARHESLSQLQAPGGFSEMLAVTIATGSREFDQRTLQIHQAPNTKSDLLYKNALLDKSRTIFSGLIIVDPDAQKTDAYQSNRNLMLSDDAESNSLPGLEIQANDVRCTHGATSSRIDPEQEFYLKARGIPSKAANELLIFGFFEEVLGRLENEELHAALLAFIQTRFTANLS
ncbi:MAG TPA: Fe-S cluster assembly protein SufD [Opitutaceae bacterium]|jgi:Fe-S cluster assembly protein SufD|nr:Fe-S cluster assembly protein SufD [Opitutaceae bacterium]